MILFLSVPGRRNPTSPTRRVDPRRSLHLSPRCRRVIFAILAIQEVTSADPSPTETDETVTRTLFQIPGKDGQGC